MKTKVYIETSGGAITGISSNDSEIDIIVVDYDEYKNPDKVEKKICDITNKLTFVSWTLFKE